MAHRLDSIRVVPEESRLARIVAPSRRILTLKQYEWAPFGGRPKSWWPDILVAFAFVLNTVFLMYPSPVVQLDSWIRFTVYDYKVEWLRDIALSVTYLGSGRAIAPIVMALTVWCAVRSKSIRPLLMFTCGFAGLGVIFILKYVFGRPMSHHPFFLELLAPNGSMLFDYIGKSTAYPSGHATNTIVFYGLAVMLVGGMMSPGLRRVVLIAPPVLVVICQTYAGYHWFFDAPAGILLGILIVRMTRRVPWTTIPLGPLQRFEPASPRLIVESAVLIVGLGLCATLPRAYGAFVAAGVVVTGLVWLVVRFGKR